MHGDTLRGPPAAPVSPLSTRPLARQQAEYSHDDYSGKLAGEWGVQAWVHRSERKVGDEGVDGGSRGSGGGGSGGGGSRGVYASVGGQPRGEMSRGWYKLYRSIDLLSEDPPLAARKLMLLLLLPLPRCAATVAVAITDSVADVAARVRLSEHIDTKGRTCVHQGRWCASTVAGAPRERGCYGVRIWSWFRRVKALVKGFISC